MISETFQEFYGEALDEIYIQTGVYKIDATTGEVEVDDNLVPVVYADEYVIEVASAKALKQATGKLAHTTRLVDEALMDALIEAERGKTYRIDGSEADSLLEWASTIPELNFLLESPRGDYMKRIITSVVAMIVPLEQLRIINPATNQPITANDVVAAGARMIKEMPYYFADASDEEKEEIAIALASGNGGEYIRKKREAGNGGGGDAGDISETDDVKRNLHPVFRVKNDNGYRVITARLTLREFAYFEQIVKGAVDVEYDPA